jgi:hypothetical protein
MLSERQIGKLFKHAVNVYCMLLEQILGRNKYTLLKTDIGAWNKFVKKYENKLCEKFVEDYIKFGVNYYLTEDRKQYYSDRIHFGWCISGKVSQRFDRLEAGTRNWIVRKGIKKENKIDTTKHDSVLKERVLAIVDSEERSKRKFYNSRRGLAWCIATTTLCNDKSELCIGCNNREQCLITLRENYNKVYRLRGYE